MIGSRPEPSIGESALGHLTRGSLDTEYQAAGGWRYAFGQASLPLPKAS
jgi:hypothetical protein